MSLTDVCAFRVPEMIRFVTQTRRGWLAAKGETIEKPTNLSHPEFAQAKSAEREKPVQRSAGRDEEHGDVRDRSRHFEGRAGVPDHDLRRRALQHRPTLTLYGHKFRYVAPPAGAPSPTSATAKSEGRNEPGHYKRRRAYSALTMDSVIFFASPSSIIVLSR